MELFVFLIKFLGFSQIAYDRCHLPGNYAIKFNTLTYEAEPFAKLKVNGEDMELVENDIYAIKLTLKKNDILADALKIIVL